MENTVTINSMLRSMLYSESSSFKHALQQYNNTPYEIFA